jgi:class 3 adenylate cyclase
MFLFGPREEFVSIGCVQYGKEQNNRSADGRRTIAALSRSERTFRSRLDSQEREISGGRVFISRVPADEPAKKPKKEGRWLRAARGQRSKNVMTRETEKLSLERRLVVVFDICSSTTILEDLKRTDHLAEWRDLLIKLKDYMLGQPADLNVELYKFIGDGWILLLPDDTPKEKLCDFLVQLSMKFAAEFNTHIKNLLAHSPSPIGLMFGIDSGELIRLEMNDQVEYLGRAINVASRLQGQTKELSGGPSYKALFSKNSYNSPPPTTPIPVEIVKVSLRNISGGEKYECLVFKTSEARRMGRSRTQESLWTRVDKSLRDAAYFWLANPVDILSASEVLKIGVVPDMIRLAPPEREQVAQIREEVINRVRSETPNALPKMSTQKFYEDLLVEADLMPGVDDIPPATAPSRLKTFQSLQSSRTLAEQRSQAIRDLFQFHAISSEAGNGFERNGTLLAISDIKYQPQGEHGSGIHLTLQPTDYYSYRVIAGCSKQIKKDLLAHSNLSIPLGFLDYANAGFQEFIHLSLGVLVVIHTLKDDRVIIRKRSSMAADFGEANKFVASANEGLRGGYIDERSGALLPFKDILAKVLTNEVFGLPAKGKKDLIALTNSIFLTGACLYLPNLSIDLCFLARTDCTAEQVHVAARSAPHSIFEFQQWCKKPGFKMRGIDEFIKHGLACPKIGELGEFMKRTIAVGSARDSWDEGSLIAVLLSTLVPR